VSLKVCTTLESEGASAPDDVDDPNAVITGGGSDLCNFLATVSKAQFALNTEKGIGAV
jgi:hypothetical protein